MAKPRTELSPGMRGEIARLYPLSIAEVQRLLPERRGYQVVDKPIPFGPELTSFVGQHHIDLNAIKDYNLAFLGFDAVRRGDNFVTRPGREVSGFEPYFLGGAETDGREVIKGIARLGKEQITLINSDFFGKVAWQKAKAVLDGSGPVTTEALKTLDDLFVRVLNAGRRRILNNPVAEQFRQSTARLVREAPGFYFYFPSQSQCLHNAYYQIMQRPPIHGLKMARFEGDPVELLSDEAPDLLEGWKLMSRLGVMGHPAVRVATDYGFLGARYGGAVGNR